MEVKNLKLSATSVGDLRVVAAHLQDAIVSIKDIANLKKNRIKKKHFPKRYSYHL